MIKPDSAKRGSHLKRDCMYGGKGITACLFLLLIYITFGCGISSSTTSERYARNMTALFSKNYSFFGSSVRPIFSKAFFFFWPVYF